MLPAPTTGSVLKKTLQTFFGVGIGTLLVHFGDIMANHLETPGVLGSVANGNENYELFRRDLSVAAKSEITPFLEIVPGLIYGFKNQEYVRLHLDPSKQRIALRWRIPDTGKFEEREISLDDAIRMTKLDFHMDRVNQKLKRQKAKRT